MTTRLQREFSKRGTMTSLTLSILATLIAAVPATAQNDSLHVTVRGVGQPVVFIPGLIGSEYGYRALISHLDTTRYRAIVIEPLGFGSSQRPEDADYSFTTQADRIAALVEHLVDEPAWFVAHSVSASIAYRLAFRHPNIVMGIVSLEGGITESLSTPGFRLAMKFVPVFRRLGPRTIMGLMRRQMANASADDSWITEERILGYTAGYQRDFDATLNALRAMSRADEPEPLVDNLALIRCPVILILGAVDHTAGPEESHIETLGQTIDSFSVVSVANAGHFVHEEKPAVVAATLERFIVGERTY